MTSRNSAAIAIAAALSVTILLIKPPRTSNGYAPRKPAASSAFRAAFESDLDTLTVALDSLRTTITRHDTQSSAMWLHHARHRYKRVEGLVEFLAPGVSGALNGPLPNDDGDAPPRPLGAPAAFQRVTTALDEHAWTSALADATLMRTSIAMLRRQTGFVNVSAEDVLAATRLELARVSTLGLAGVDASAERAIPEAADALDGLRTQLASLGNREIDTTLANAIAALRANPDFEQLDRLTFVTQFVTPAARAVGKARGRTVATRRRAWRDQTSSVFDDGALDASAYAPEFAPPSTPALIALGKRMFFDANLSGARAQSCATCHNPDKAFTDDRARSATFGEGTHGAARNTPTLVNAALQPELFADERAKSLEDQVGKVLASPSEMQSSADLAATRLRVDASYRSAFRATLHDSVLTELSVRVALAAYIRSLTSLDSRFDRAIRGDALAMNAEERHGFTLFMGKARCGSCHFAPLFNGTMPPDFVISEPEIIGVPRSTATRSPIDGDIGRAAVDGITQHRFAFKVPTLRNIALTAPYMHNGVYRTLEEVVAFYDRGGSRSHPTPTLAPDSLHLTRDERSALVAFMRSLTDTTFIVPAASRRR